MTVTAPRAPATTGATVATAVPAPGSANDRLRLAGPTGRAAALDGAWWPHTTDPEAELPALVTALGGSRGTVTHLILHAADWAGPHPRRVTVDGRAVRLGWFTSQPAGLLTAVCDVHADRFDLLVVPPAATPASASAAMTAAADASNTRSAPALLADVRTT